MTIVVPLFLLAPLVLVPLGLRLLPVATPGSEPPIALRRAAVPAAWPLALSFVLSPGPLAAALALPWLAVTGLMAAAAGYHLLRGPDTFRLSPRLATDAAVAYLAIGASFAVTDRLGVRPFGFTPEVILLTAVHFHFAGFILPLAGTLARRRRPNRGLDVALACVIAGIPITALGFFGFPLVNWAGSMLVATGGFAIGVGTLSVARTMTRPPGRSLATVAGVSVLLAMPLAAVYATGMLIGAAWLDLATMARIHGGLNSLGFAAPIVLAWTLDWRPEGRAA
jgi:YndJ-like protein